MTYSGDRALELSDYFRVLRRRRLIIFVGAVLGAALGLGFTQLTGQVYEATTSLLVRPVAVDVDAVDRPDQLINLETERELIRSTTIAQRAAAVMSVSDAGAILERLSVAVPGSPQVLELTYTANSPEAAQQGAQAFANAYLEHRQEEAQRRVDGRRDDLLTQIASAEEEFLIASERMVASEEDSLEHALAAGEAERLAARLQGLEQALAQNNLVDVDPGEVIVPATVPAGPSSQPAWLVVILATISMAVLSIPAAFLRERLDQRLRDPDDLRGLEGVPVLAVLPLRGDTSPKALSSSGKPLEPYRKVAFTVVSEPAHSDNPKVGIVGMRNGTSESWIASVLAVTIARLNHSALVISLDETQPLTRHMDISPTPSLNNALRGNASLPEIVQKVPGIPRLGAVTGGIPLGTMNEWNEFTALIDKMARATDVLVVNAGPTADTVDTLQLTSLMGQVILVVERDGPRYREVVAAIAELRRYGANLTGLVFVTRPSLTERLRSALPGSGTSRSSAP